MTFGPRERVVCVALALLAGCGGDTRSIAAAKAVPASASDAFRVLDADDFLFRIDIETASLTTESIAFFANGTVVHIQPNTAETSPGSRVWLEHWTQETSSISPHELAELRSRLARIRFPDLKTRYVDPRVADGAVTDFTLRSGEQTKRIHCSNLFPPPLLELIRYSMHLLRPPLRVEPLTRDEAARAWEALTR